MIYTNYIILALLMFTIGAVTVIIRRSILISLLGIELMLNAANLMLVTFSRIHTDIEGQTFAFSIIIVAAAEVVIGLALIISIFKTKNTTSIDQISDLKY
ncbi:NADH-quinone oxidoreductase subunit NuoK [Actinomyces sp. zg-332]|uniref:NADH-quinone oxidoreductase subunit NuoK n=1 Tax=Actinomyces sp. zg-332 TaxID=2708340 RepID=UPI00141DF5BC|nr:NADH-quinone oxidoreductase subunit NuoK [Actinomyces sp. zg-332]QPK94014.1 NADH-quinone oxidoreductase subunit NuoK [Actinomyces sp. zg-332]